MYVSEFILIAAVEMTVVVSIVAVVLFFVMREKIKRLELALKVNGEYQLVADNSVLVEEASCSSSALSSTSTGKNTSNKESLDIANKKIANLEKFKALYFSSEAALAAAERALNMTSVLEATIREQQQEISDLTELLSQEKKHTSAEHKYSEELEEAVLRLEASQAQMSKEVELAKSSIDDVRLLTKEIGDIKKKANALMKESGDKNIDIINYKKMVAKLKAQNLSAPGSGQLAKENELLMRLSEKDKLIQQLKNECDTLGTQYHQLAVQSLDAQKSTPGNSVNTEVDDILIDLAQSAKELMASKLACQDLENGLSDISEQDIPKYQLQLDAAVSRKTDCENNYRCLSSKVESMVSADHRAELQRIKDEMNKKTHETEVNTNEHTIDVIQE